MSKLSTDLGSVRPLHPREALFATGTLGALNAEVIADSDSCGTVTLDLRGTLNLIVAVEGTVDGVNWILIPIKSITGGIYVVSTSAAGTFIGDCSGFRKVRARCTTYTSGSATTFIVASNCPTPPIITEPYVQLATGTAAVNTATSLTLGAPGAGLRHYLTGVRIQRFATALLSAGAAPVLSTATTNIPTSMVFTLPADAAVQGSVYTENFDFNEPLQTTAQNTATAITMPATANVIWRITASFFVAP
jgi:hypothetical protein